MQKSNSDKLKQNIGILFHAYPKSKGDVSLGIGAGISIPIESSTSFFGGPSLLFNGKTRFVITAGICYLKLKELNKSNLKSRIGNENYEFEIKTTPIYFMTMSTDRGLILVLQ